MGLPIKYIGAGFVVIITGFLALGSFALVQMRELAMDVENIYHHPLAVSNATRDVMIQLASMHDGMKEIVLAEVDAERDAAVAGIVEARELAKQRLAILRERFLGDKRDVRSLETKLEHWDRIVQELVRLKRAGKNQEAAEYAAYEGTAHILELKLACSVLSNYAGNKAADFRERAREKRRSSLMVISLLLGILVLFSGALAYAALKNLSSGRREVSRYLRMVDQNIMNATMDGQGKLTGVTNALCRYLETTKAELGLGGDALSALGLLEGEASDEVHRIIATGGSWRGEVSRVNARGQQSWAELSLVSDSPEAVETAAYSIFVQDITDKKRVEELSITDGLTSLHNRRHFEVILAHEIRVASRLKGSLVLGVLDVDFFKAYNDHYGHPAGDDVLVRLARFLRTSFQRPGDFVFRIGGEEFALLFGSDSLETATAHLEKARMSVFEDLAIRHVASDVAERVTVTIGAVYAHGDGLMGWEDLYRKADEALYKGKQTRNTVVVEDMS